MLPADLERLAGYLTTKVRLFQYGYEDPLAVQVASVVADCWMVFSGVLTVDDYRPEET